MARKLAALCFIAAFISLLLIPVISDAACRLPAAPILPAFYVSTTGNDANAGTIASPFATLQAAQTAMRNSGTVKLTYVRAGSYTLQSAANCPATHTCGLVLSSADNGTTYSYYPPEGIRSANFTGSSTTGSNGFDRCVYSDGTNNNVTINGLSIHNCQIYVIFDNGSTNSIFTNNELSFTFNSGANGAAINCYSCTGATWSNNYVHDMFQFGISAVSPLGQGSVSNTTVSGNFLQNTCTGVADCGALYSQDQNSISVNVKFLNNYVRDGNTFATLGSNLGSALYADDCMSNVTYSGNIVTGRNGSNTTHIHGGINIVFNGNLFDFSTNNQKAIAFQTSSSTGCSTGAMTGNKFQDNILISGGGGGGYVTISGSPLNPPTISNNSYFNYAGSAISSTGDYTDSNPTTQNPQLNCWVYTIAGGSPVFNSPVLFPGLPSSWGPPGFTVTQTGTVPSSPHAC